MTHCIAKVNTWWTVCQPGFLQQDIELTARSEFTDCVVNQPFLQCTHSYTVYQFTLSKPFIGIHWSVSFWRDPDDVPHCRILSPDKTEWRLISATLCRWRRCFVADQLWFMTRTREEDWNTHRQWTDYRVIFRFCCDFVMVFSSSRLRSTWKLYSSFSWLSWYVAFICCNCCCRIYNAAQ